VWQPLRPLPRGQRLGRAEHGDPQLLRGVEGHRRAQQRAHQRPAPPDVVAGDLHAGEGAQVHGRGQVALHPMGHEQAVQRRGRHRVEQLDRRRVRGDQRQRQRLRRDAVPDVQEVHVLRRPLPHSGALLGHGGQSSRVRMGPGLRGPLGRGGLPSGRTDLVEVAEVLPAAAGCLALPLSALAGDAHRDEAQRCQQEHRAGDQAAWPGLACCHEHDGPDAAQHRQRSHQDGAAALVRLDLRRGLQHQLAGGGDGRVQARPAAQSRRHVTSTRMAAARAPPTA